MPRDLTALFCPKSVAVIGASRSGEKLGAIILKNIIDSKFPGQVYPVNPNTDSVNNLKCYQNVEDIPEVPDLAVVALPAPKVLESLELIGGKGIKNVVVIAAGFKETGEKGQKLEEQLVSLSQKYELNLLGPNCLGFVNQFCPINATFGQPVSVKGNLRFISQSGAIAASIFDWSESSNLGFREFVTLGNKSILNESDVLHYFQTQTENVLSGAESKGLSSLNPIGLYLESIENGEEFLRLTREISQTNPLLLLKPGKTEAAVEAMQSHTGAIAGEDDVLDSVFKQAGGIRCQTLEDFYNFSKSFAWENLPLGPKVAVISNAGGPAVISADAVVEHGLELAEFDSQTKEQLSKVLPRSSSIVNPIDLLGDALADRFSEAMDVILQKEQVHSLVVILTPQVMTQIEKTAVNIGKLSSKYNKPIVCSFMGGSRVAEGEKILNRYKIPSFRFPERAVGAIGAMWWYKKRREEQAPANDENNGQDPHVETNVIQGIIQKASSNNQKALDSLAVNQLLSAVSIPTPPARIVTNEEEANEFAVQYGWPVVMKLSSPGLLHKREVGGVIVDIRDENQINDAWYKLERKQDQLDENIRDQIKFQIQKEIIGGVEVIVGITRDETFGPVLLFGAGGSFAEIIEDRNLHLLPIGLSGVEKLVKGSKIYSVLQGLDGEPPYALEKLYELILRFSKLVRLLPEVSDIEINPVIVTINSVWAVDGKVVLGREKREASAPRFQVATVRKQEVFATKIHHYEFETEKPFVFKPGQYVSLKVARDAVRSYSIACYEGENKFDLLVDTKPGGPGSNYFENLKVGDKITFLGPFGVFTLNLDDGAKHLLFLATGTGISAIRCMIDSALKEHKTHLPINFYFGLTKVEEIFWQDYLDKLRHTHPNFRYEIAIFQPDETWQGYKGFITDLVARDFPDASKCSAYLCGNKDMIADARKLLINNGCPEERIYTEKFA